WSTRRPPAGAGGQRGGRGAGPRRATRASGTGRRRARARGD
ncbi:MAG: hypothetical protein AVDCRST_MAG07-991, partial [uncultured Frankineae bacterium]